MAVGSMKFLFLFILYGFNDPFILAEEEGCNKAGIYPGNSKREFIVCAPGGSDGKQMIRTKHACPINSVYKDHRCVPTTIVPYSGPEGVDTDAKKNKDDQGNNKEDDIKLPCKSSGLLCTTCKQLSICIGEEDNAGKKSYHEVTMMTCPADQICSVDKGCTPFNKGAYCPYRKFKCSDVGTYPDPYDCTVYYTCVPTSDGFNQTKITCSDGSFDSATNSCDYPMTRTSCITTPVPICKDIFQMGPTAENLNIYYICIPDDNDHTLAPVLYRCPGNLKFDISTLQCS